MENPNYPIKGKKNGGVILFDKVPNSFNDLKIGDRYVYLKGNRILNLMSPSAVDDEIGKVVWYYNIKDVDRVIGTVDETLITIYNQLKRNNMLKKVIGIPVINKNTFKAIDNIQKVIINGTHNYTR